VLHTLKVDPPMPNGPAVSLDGTLAAAVTADGTVRVRDMASGDEVRRFETSQSRDAVFAWFNRDNRWLAVTSATGSVTVWNVADGQRIAGPLEIGSAGYALFDPTTPTRLLVGGRNGVVAAWDLAVPGRPTPHLLGATGLPTNPSDLLLFYPAANGGRVAAGDPNPSDGVPIVVLDIASGTEVARLEGSPGAISADGRFVALRRPTTSAIEVVDVDTGATVSKPMPQIVAPGSVMSFDAAGTHLAVFDYDNQQVRVMDWRTGQQVDSVEFPGVTAPTYIDGDRLLLRNTKRAAVVDLAATSNAGAGYVPPIAEHYPRSCCGGAYQFAPDGRVVSNTADGTGVVVSDADDATHREVLPIPASALDKDVFVVSPDRSKVVTFDDDTERIEVLERSTGEVLLSFGQPGPVGMKWSPDSSALSLRLTGDAIYLWRVGDREPRLVRAKGGGVDPGQFTPVGELAWRPDGRELLIGLYGTDVAIAQRRRPGTARARDLPSGERMHGGVSYRPDGRAFVLVTESDQTDTSSVVVVDDSSRKVIVEHALDHSLGGIAYYDGGRRVATLGEANADVVAQSNRFDLWDADSFAPIARVDLDDIATSIIPSPDGHHVLIVSRDRTATVWDLRPSTWVARSCEVADRTLTRKEWMHYLPNIPYDPPCR